MDIYIYEIVIYQTVFAFLTPNRHLNDDKKILSIIALSTTRTRNTNYDVLKITLFFFPTANRRTIIIIDKKKPYAYHLLL